MVVSSTFSAPILLLQPLQLVGRPAGSDDDALAAELADDRGAEAAAAPAMIVTFASLTVIFISLSALTRSQSVQ